ncbi:MAG: TolC family protein [Verrucomicrobiota bacterium]|nr:TolC family protein [Verrucomicrobiota bacterium]
MKTISSPFHPVLLLASLMLFTGCTRFEPARVRREQTASFISNLNAKAEAYVNQPLTLTDCIQIAMTNNYDVRRADLDQELARIGRNVAFTAFLPNVAASAGYNAYSKDPRLTSKEFGTAAIDIGMPIFMPSAWFLYASAQHGYAAAGMAAHYTRQNIVLQTTLNYYNVAVQQETIWALESQLEAARETAHRVEGLATEGFITQWEKDQALYQVEAREVELTHARRQLRILRSELLQGLGLSPFTHVELADATDETKRPGGTIEDLVLKALEIHPQLSIADRQVVMKEHAVRQAFCSFIPTVSLFANHEWTGNDLAAHSANWVAGFSGVWTLFDGLANVARYRAAKVERREARLDRENTFLSVIVGVISAEAALNNAIESARLYQRSYDVAAAKYADYDAKAKEGVIPLSDALDARADMDLAQVVLVKSRYQAKIATANLELAMGITLLPEAVAPSAEEPVSEE